VTIVARHKYLPLSIVADDYGISIKTLRRRIAEGTLPAYRVGGQVRVRETDLEQLARRIPAGSLR
jgi:excisionase family DNA binding protein